MLDLDSAAVERWLAQHQPGAPRTPVAEIGMDDLARVQAALGRLVLALNDAGVRDPTALARLLREPAMASGLQTVLAHLSSARHLRVFSWLEEIGAKDCLPILWADTPGPDGINPGAIVRKSLQRLHRVACLSRLFAPGRLEQLLHLCERGS